MYSTRKEGRMEGRKQGRKEGKKERRKEGTKEGRKEGRKPNWIGQFSSRNCLLKQVIVGKIAGNLEVTGRRGRRSEQLFNDIKEWRGYCKLKEEH